MTREELEIELKGCVDYLSSNEIDIIFRQRDVELLHYYHQNCTKQASAVYGDSQEHIRVCERLIALRQLLLEMGG